MSPDIGHSNFPRQPGYILVALILAFSIQDCTDSGAIVPDLNGQISAPWPTFRGNFQRSGQSQYLGAQTGEVVWTQILDSTDVFSTPAVSLDSVVYVGTSLGNSKGNFYAVGPDGIVRWVFRVGSGVDSSPTIGPDGTIYIGAHDGAVYALSRDGGLRWKYQTGGPIGLSSPAIDELGQVLVCSFDSCVYCLDESGALRWKFSAGRPIGGSVAVGKNGNYYVHGEKLYALDHDGNLQWGIPVDTPARGVVSTPAVGPDGSVYVLGETRLTAVTQNGTVSWEYTFEDAAGTPYTSPAVSADGTIYAACRWSMYAFGQNGSLRWTIPLPLVRTVESSPAIGLDGTVYVGVAPSSGGGKNLYAIRPSGQILFSIAIKNISGKIGDVTSSPVIAQDGAVIVGSDYGGFGLARVR